MHQEELLSRMGVWGRFHSRLLAVLTIPIIQNGFQTLMVVITLAVPQHRCRIPSLDNDTFEIQSEWHRHLVASTIPSTVTAEGDISYDSCHVYVNATTYDVSNVSYSYVNMTEGEARIAGCNGWVYDQSELKSTVMSYFNLVCNRKEFRAHINMAYIIGIFIGSPLAGFFCDAFGRKRVLFAALLVNAVVGMLSAFPFLPIVFLVYRMLKGAISITVYMSIFVLCVEMVGAQKRNTIGSLIAVLWVLGPFLLGGVSYVLRDWQHLHLLSALPNILALLCWKLVPESPRWLLSKGHVSQAVKVVRKAARINGNALPLPEDEQEIGEQPQQSQATMSISKSVRELVRHPRLVVRTLIVFFNWSAVSMAYYGLSLNVANLWGSVRVNFLLSTTVELAGYVSAWVLLDRLGRKRTLCLGMMLAGLACLATIFPGLYMGAGSGWVTMALAMVGKLGISSAFASVYLVSAELFPTGMRNFALGCCSTAGRVGSVTSPYIADLALHIEGKFGQVLPLIILGGTTVVAALLTLLLPETLGRKLPDSVLEAVHFGKKTSKRIGTEETEMAEVNGGKQAQPFLDGTERKA